MTENKAYEKLLNGTTVSDSELSLERLYLEVFSWNGAARSLYEKFGFKLEGTARSHVYSDGHFHDVALYGLLRKEFHENEDRVGKSLYQTEGQ